MSNSKSKKANNLSYSDTYFLQQLIGKDIKPTDVKKHKRYYDKTYGKIATIYGFKDFTAMYNYCKSTDSKINKSTDSQNHVIATASGGKSKEKDTSDLILATKQGMRNGKPYTSRYWTDPNKGSNNSQHNVDNSSEKDGSVIASDGLYLGGEKFGKPLATTKDNSKPPASWSIVGTYRKSCFDYIYEITNNEITFMSGIKKDNDIISIVYASAPNDKDLLGHIHTLLSKIIKEAWLADYGVQFSPSMFSKYETIDVFCEAFKLKRINNTYKATPSQLQAILGDSSCIRVLQ